MLTWGAKGAATPGGTFKPILLFGKLIANIVKGINQGDSVIGGETKGKNPVLL